jgi:hypothetical protein
MCLTRAVFVLSVLSVAAADEKLQGLYSKSQFFCFGSHSAYGPAILLEFCSWFV